MNEFGFDFFNQLKVCLPDLGNTNALIAESETGLTELWFDQFKHFYLIPQLTPMYAPVAQAILIAKLRQYFAEESPNVKRFVESFISNIAMPHANVLDEKFAEQFTVQLDEINIQTRLNTEQLSHVKATVNALVDKTQADIRETMNLVAGEKLLGIKACIERAYKENKELNTSIQTKINEYMQSNSAHDKKERNQQELKNKLAAANTVDERRTVWRDFQNAHLKDTSKFGHLIKSVIEMQEKRFVEIDKALNDLKRLMAELQVICTLDVLSKEAEEMKQCLFNELQPRVTLTQWTETPPISTDNASTALGYLSAQTRVDTTVFSQLSAAPPPPVVMGTVTHDFILPDASSASSGKLLDEKHTNQYCSENLKRNALAFLQLPGSGAYLKSMLESGDVTAQSMLNITVELYQSNQLSWRDILPLAPAIPTSIFELFAKARPIHEKELNDLSQFVLSSLNARECLEALGADMRNKVTACAILLLRQKSDLKWVDLMPLSRVIAVKNFKEFVQNLPSISDEDLDAVRILVSESSAPREMLKCLSESDHSGLKTHIEKALRERRLQWQEVIPLNFLFSKDEFDLIEETRVDLIASSAHQTKSDAQKQEMIDVANFIAKSPSAYSCYSIFLRPTVKQYPKYLTNGVIDQLDNLLMQKATQIGTSNRIAEGKEDKDQKIKQSVVKIQLIMQEYHAVPNQSEGHKQELIRLLKEEFITLSKIVSTHRSINFLGCSKTKSEQALAKFLSAPEQSLLRGLLGISQTAGVNVSKAVESFLDECKKKDVSEIRDLRIQSHP